MFDLKGSTTLSPFEMKKMNLRNDKISSAVCSCLLLKSRSTFSKSNIVREKSISLKQRHCSCYMNKRNISGKSFFEERFYLSMTITIVMLITSFKIGIVQGFISSSDSPICKKRNLLDARGKLSPFYFNCLHSKSTFKAGRVVSSSSLSKYSYDMDTITNENHFLGFANTIRMNSPMISHQSNRKAMYMYSIKQKKDHQDFDGISYIEMTDLHSDDKTNPHLNQDNANQSQNENSIKSHPSESRITTKESEEDLLNPITKGKHAELKTKIEKKIDFNIEASSTSSQDKALLSKAKNVIGGSSHGRRGQILTKKPFLAEANLLIDDNNHHNVALGYVSTENLHNIEIQYVAECDMPTELGHFRFRAYKCNPVEKLKKKIETKERSHTTEDNTDDQEEKVLKEDQKQREQLLQKLTGLEPVVMMKGKIKKGINDENVLLRVHDQCLTSEVFGSRRCDCKEQLELALKKVNELEEDMFGCVVYLQQEGRGIGLANKVAAYSLQDKGADTVDANRQLGFQDDERTYEVIPQIMEDLGIKSIQLMTNNPFKVKVLKSLGVNISKVVPIIVQPNKDNFQYLFSKANRMEHNLDLALHEVVNTETNQGTGTDM